MSEASNTNAPAGELSPNFHVAHHFDSADTQFDAGKMGIWLFLVTEVLLFGGLFCAFAIFRSWYYPAFVEAHHHLDKVMGGTNTIVIHNTCEVRSCGGGGRGCTPMPGSP